MGVPRPINEEERLKALRSYQVVDTPPEEMFDDIARLAAAICGTKIALVSLLEEDRQWFKAKLGWTEPETSRDAAFCSYTILGTDVMVVPDTLKDERFAAHPFVLQDPQIRFYAGMPMINPEGHALGTVCVIGKSPKELSPMQEDALRILGRSSAACMEVKRMHLELDKYRTQLEQLVDQRTKQLQSALKRIETTYDDTLRALGAALDLRDNETAGHSRRVTRYCVEIAKAMGCGDDDIKQIRRGSFLHDIGKIGIPDSILFKPGKLTDEERAIMETHARIGYDLIAGIAFLAPASQIALTHQERFDGTGYPQGLVGKEIPLGARIFSVADTLDAMTSDRPYRKALPFSAARAEIERESGHQFDPEVVKAFLSVPEEVFAAIRAEARQDPFLMQTQRPA